MDNSHSSSIASLPVRKATNATERKGVAFVRDAVEDSNCVFKEIDRASDYGHDAFVLLVDDEQVMPQEFAIQVKAGRSYCKAETCAFHSTDAQLNFWSQHPLQTLGIVYDPDAVCAWWVDLKLEAKSKPIGGSGRTICFVKEEWNRFDSESFKLIVLPVLLGEPPRIDLQTAITWLQSDSWYTHDLGARTLISRHRNEPASWTALLNEFETRGRASSFSVYRSLVRIMNHPEEGALPNTIPETDRSALKQRVLNFRESQCVELLHFVDDNGFERGSAGYGLFGILPNIPDHIFMLQNICSDKKIQKDVRDSASLLLAIRANDPDWWGLWKRPHP